MTLTAMPFAPSSHLEIGSNGLRILSAVLAAAILIWWTPCVWRILRGREKHPDDGQRAGWVPLAAAVLTFQIRWFWPHMTDLDKVRLTFVAQTGMVMALLFAIYVHGHGPGAGRPRLRRAILLHGGMLALCVGATSILR